jgi:hypothetical protein
MGDRIKFEIKLDKSDREKLMQAFQTMPKEAQTQLRRRNKIQMAGLAQKITSAANYAPNPAQAKMVARSIRPNKDRFPSITIGGARKAPVKRKGTERNPKPTYGELLYGVEFGASENGKGRLPNGGRRFPFFSGRYGYGSRGYFIYPTLRKNQERIRQDFIDTVEKVIFYKWGKNSG